MSPIGEYHLITPDDLSWRPSNLMKIPNADYLERTGRENLGARLWRLPPGSANTLHKHVHAEVHFVLEGTGRMRVGDDTLTVPRYGAVFVSPDQLRQVFNDTDADVLWLRDATPLSSDQSPMVDRAQMDSHCAVSVSRFFLVRAIGTAGEEPLDNSTSTCRIP